MALNNSGRAAHPQQNSHHAEHEQIAIGFVLSWERIQALLLKLARFCQRSSQRTTNGYLSDPTLTRLAVSDATSRVTVGLSLYVLVDQLTANA